MHEREYEREPGEELPEAPEDRSEEPGAEGGGRTPAADNLPGTPAKDDDTPVGDTDQHSKG